MLKELDRDDFVFQIDADMGLDEAVEENRRHVEARLHRLKLAEPAAGVDDNACFLALSAIEP